MLLLLLLACVPYDPLDYETRCADCTFPDPGPCNPEVGPDIHVEVETFDLDDTHTGLPVELRLANLGDDDLHVLSAEFDRGEASSFEVSDLGSVLVPPGQETFMELAVTAEGPGAYRDVLRIRSDDCDEPEVLVEVLGRR